MQSRFESEQYLTTIIFSGVLSGWMRYTGYHLDGQTRKEEFAVPTVQVCWKACLLETNFGCFSVAYSGVGSRSCRLYDKKTLSAHAQLSWRTSPEFTYYEYCVNGWWYGLSQILGALLRRLCHMTCFIRNGNWIGGGSRIRLQKIAHFVSIKELYLGWWNSKNVHRQYTFRKLTFYQ